MADGSPKTAAPQPWRQTGDGPLLPLPAVDRDAFAAEIAALRRELVADLGPADRAHLLKMERWGRGCTLLGYACARSPARSIIRAAATAATS
jgi:hypothetical protein